MEIDFSELRDHHTDVEHAVQTVSVRVAVGDVLVGTRGRLSDDLTSYFGQINFSFRKRTGKADNGTQITYLNSVVMPDEAGSEDEEGSGESGSAEDEASD